MPLKPNRDTQTKIKNPMLAHLPVPTFEKFYPTAQNRSFLGYEQQAESIWTYFEVKNITGVKQVDVMNNLLHDYNTAQINMMHIKVGDNEQSYKLDYPESKTSFKF